MFFIKLAFRNLRRHPRRTIITAAIIAMAVIIYITMQGLMGGLTEMSYENIINLETGHLQIMKEEYRENRKKVELDNLINSNSDFLSNIESEQEVEAVAPQLSFGINLNNGIDEIPVIGVGMIPEQNEKVFRLKQYLTEGRMPQTGKSEVIMGARLAELMEFSVGDYPILLFKDINDTFNTLDAQIVGLYDAPHPALNDNYVFLSLDRAQRSLNLNNQITHYSVLLKERALTQSAVNNINQQLSDQLKAYSWEDFAGTTIAMAEAGEVEIYAMLVIVLIIAGVGIINTLILSTLERQEELGMMKALGMKEGGIVFTFILEAVGIAILGTLFGILISALILYLFNLNGLDTAIFTGGGETTYGLAISGKIYLSWQPASFVIVFVYSLVISILASIFPSYWAARKDAVKSIYHR